MPLPVYGGRAVTDDSLIYIVGGYSDSLFSPVNYIQSYNPLNNEWKLLDDTLQTGRYGFVSGVYQNQLYITGGVTTNEKLVHHLECWDFNGSTVTVDSNYNFNRIFATGVVFENYFYIIGGRPNYLLPIDSLGMPYIFGYQIDNTVDSYENYDFLGNTIESDIPYHQSAILFNNDIYIFGGVYNVIIIEVYRFNHGEKSWLSIYPALYEERAGADVVQATPEMIMIIGGYNESEEAMSSTEYYNPAENISDYGPELNFARKELMAVKFGDNIYVFGGRDKNGRTVSQVEFLNPNETTGIGSKEIMNVDTFEIHRNFPNPFNPSTNIPLTINKAENIQLEILDINGKRIQSVFNGFLPKGTYQFTWDGRNSLGKSVSSGIYFYRVKTSRSSKSNRMILMR
jgi:hypothetical protein